MDREQPVIPFGFKRISGQAQKGDGVWNGTRFVKVRKEYPWAEGSGARIIIRKCVVEQTELPVLECGDFEV